MATVATSTICVMHKCVVYCMRVRRQVITGPTTGFVMFFFYFSCHKTMSRFTHRMIEPTGIAHISTPKHKNNVLLSEH